MGFLVPTRQKQKKRQNKNIVPPRVFISFLYNQIILERKRCVALPTDRLSIYLLNRKQIYFEGGLGEVSLERSGDGMGEDGGVEGWGLQ